MRTPVIAIVDEDASVRKALTRLLKAAGVDATGFASAWEFLQGGLATPPDCLILEIHLGEMTGFELYETLVKEGQAIPVVFVTAREDVEMRERARQLGVYLQKPFGQHGVLGAIYHALKQEAA